MTDSLRARFSVWTWQGLSYWQVWKEEIRSSLQRHTEKQTAAARARENQRRLRMVAFICIAQSTHWHWLSERLREQLLAWPCTVLWTKLTSPPRHSLHRSPNMSSSGNRIWFTCAGAGHSFPISKIAPLPTNAAVHAAHCKLPSKWSARRHFYWPTQIYCVDSACCLGLEVNGAPVTGWSEHTAPAGQPGATQVQTANKVQGGETKERESWMLLFVSESSPPTNSCPVSRDSV